MLQLIQELQIKSTTVMSWSLRKKKEGIFCTVYFVRREFFQDLRFISMYSVLNTLSEFKLLHIKKHFFRHFCCLFLKSKAFSVSLSMKSVLLR